MRPSSYGPWNPGIQSALPARLLPRSTIFRPENAFTSVTLAAELHDLTGLPMEELAVFRPQRLLVHELLIRVTADISVPDPEEAGIDALGVNFRRMTETIFVAYIRPHLPELEGAYESLKHALSIAIQAELSELLAARTPKQAGARPRLRTWRARLFRILDGSKRVPAANGDGTWQGEEHRLRTREPGLEASEAPVRQAARQALVRVTEALRARHGRWWGDRALLGELALGLACNAYGSVALGRLIEPIIAEACAREGYRVLAPQARPVITNVKGASASGKSTMRPLQQRLAAKLGLEWRDFALVTPDIWRKTLLDYTSLGEDYKYAGSLAGVELAIVDLKLDRYIARKATDRGIPHLLIDRFRFDSFAPDSDEAGSNLLTRFGASIYMFFMVTPPHETVERAWKRGRLVGRYKAVDDLLAHNVEAYAGMPALFFTWALHPRKSVHYEFLDNDVPLGVRPRTIAFGQHGEMNILDVGGMLAIDRYRKINVAARTPSEVYPEDGTMDPASNVRFLNECVRRIPVVNFAERASGRVYARFEAGRLVATDVSLLAHAFADAETRIGLSALRMTLRGASPADGSLPVLRPAATNTLGRWGERAAPMKQRAASGAKPR